MGEDPIEQKRIARAVPTFAEFIDQQYLPFIRTYKKSWGTDLSLLKNHLLPRFGTRYLDEISRIDIVGMHAARRASGAAPGSANRLLILMRYCYNLAIRWEVPGIKANPCAGVPLLEVNNKKERYLSQEEAKRLYEAVCESQNPMLRYVVPMLILSGARKREVLDAKWEDFDLERRIWRIPTTKAGLADVRMHDLRHSFASLLINSGRSLYEVQKLLGNTQVKTTQRYAHLAPETLLAASNAATLAVGSIMGVMPNRIVDVPLVAVQG